MISGRKSLDRRLLTNTVDFRHLSTYLEKNNKRVTGNQPISLGTEKHITF